MWYLFDIYISLVAVCDPQIDKILQIKRKDFKFGNFLKIKNKINGQEGHEKYDSPN